ncbi:MAG: hypothetical protein ACRD1A_13290, partial [Terriglobales bacterium]
MKRFCWRMAQVMARALKPDEREAVLGDLAEAGEIGGQGLRHIMGLVVLRQITGWCERGESLARVGAVGTVAFAAGWALNSAAMRLGFTYDLYLWIFRNRLDIAPTILRQIGHTMAHGVEAMIMGSCLLALWSCLAGSVLGLLAPGGAFGRWMSASMFLLPLTLGVAWYAAMPYPYSVQTGARP